MLLRSGGKECSRSLAGSFKAWADWKRVHPKIFVGTNKYSTETGVVYDSPDTIMSTNGH